MSVNINKATFLAFAVFFSAVCFAFLPATTYAASYYFSPSAATYHVGETFQANVYVSSPDQPINTCQANIGYPQDILSVISVSTKNSIFSLMVENPTFSNNSGIINFSGIILNPGYTGKSGKLVSVNFSAKQVGTAKVTIPAGQVLANDGVGTEVLNSRGSATFTILPAKAVVKPATPISLPVEAPVIVTTTVTTTITETTTLYIVTSTACTLDQLPDFFLRLGPIYFDSPALAMLILIILLIISAMISLWGFYEVYINKNSKHHHKKMK